jgi:hypothetical protein
VGDVAPEKVAAGVDLLTLPVDDGVVVDGVALCFDPLLGEFEVVPDDAQYLGRTADGVFVLDTELFMLEELLVALVLGVNDLRPQEFLGNRIWPAKGFTSWTSGCSGVPSACITSKSPAMKVS